MATKNWRKRVDERLGGNTGVAPPTWRPSRRLSAVATEPEVRPQPVVVSQKNDQPVTGARVGQTTEKINRGIHIPMLDPSSFVPPSAEPPHVPDSGMDVDEHRSLRVYVILGCFIFGLIIGFLYHVTKEEETLPEREQERTVINGGAGIPEQDDTADDESAKDQVVESVDEVTTQGKDNTGTIIEDVEGILPGQNTLRHGEASYISLLPKESYGGLNGSNAPAPDFAAAGGSDTVLEPEMMFNDNTAGPELDLDF